MKDYKISIVMPVYNGSDYIGFALDSLINQTYKNLEIIVVNDGSTDQDKTKEVVSRYLSDQRIKYFEKENGGVSSAINFGISKCTGDFFVWLSHDDAFKVNSLEERLNKWIKCGASEQVIISTSTQFIDQNGKNKFRVAAKSRNLNDIADILSSVVNGCSLLIPLSQIRNKKMRTDMIYMQDYYMWAEMICDGCRFVNIKKKLTYSRVHNKQVTVNANDKYDKDFAIFAKDFVEPLLEKKDYSQIRRIIHMMQQKIYIRPCYKNYIFRYKDKLKKAKKWNMFSSIHTFFDRMIAKAVKIARRIK